MTVTLTITEASDDNLIVEIDPGRMWPLREDGSLDVDALTNAEAAAIYASQCIAKAGSNPSSGFTILQ